MILRLPLAALTRAFVALLILTVAAGATVAPSGSADTGEQNGSAKSDADPLGRSTPQGLVKGLMAALANGNYERAERFFEKGSVYVLAGQSVSLATSAREFHKVLDRVGMVATPAQISPSPEGDMNDGLAQNLERFGIAKAGDTEVALLAKRVEQKEGAPIWLVSAETLSAMGTLSRLNARKPFERSLLDQVPEGPSVGGAPVSHWLALLLVACIIFTVSIALVSLRRRVFRLLKWKPDETRFVKFVDASAMPLRLTIAAALFVAIVSSQTLGLSLLARYQSIFLAQIVAGIGLAWLVWRLAETASVYALDQMAQRGQVAAYSVVSFLKRLVQGAILVAFAFVVIRSLGIDVTTAVAALGLGGLAVALGAQKLFENLIGSLTLIADRPVRVGDFCQFGDALGTVEDIGIRSTRIRTLNRTVLTVPNGAFASMQIENYTSRDQFWFHPTLNLRYETSPDQIRYLLQELRAMLYAHPRINPNPARVRLISLGAHSIDLEIFAYVNASNFDDFLEIQEDLLLRCMEIVKQSGTGFAFPSQTLYVARDDGIDEKKTRKAEDAVHNWRDTGSLQYKRRSKNPSVKQPSSSVAPE
ncbi:MAG: mechanosensitive ion channel family protein [Rhodoplanes sp.]